MSYVLLSCIKILYLSRFHHLCPALFRVTLPLSHSAFEGRCEEGKHTVVLNEPSVVAVRKGDRGANKVLAGPYSPPEAFFGKITLELHPQ
jgi:hypothetical protein